MATLHFEDYPYRRNLFGVSEEEIDGKFEGWQKNARYEIDTTVVLTLRGTDVSPAEYQIAPNIRSLPNNTAILHIYNSWSYTGSFQSFQTYYANREMSLQRYVDDLTSRLNTARHVTLPGSWTTDFTQSDRRIRVFKA
jgi:hypothetical protein